MIFDWSPVQLLVTFPHSVLPIIGMKSKFPPGSRIRIPHVTLNLVHHHSSKWQGKERITLIFHARIDPWKSHSTLVSHAGCCPFAISFLCKNATVISNNSTRRCLESVNKCIKICEICSAQQHSIVPSEPWPWFWVWIGTHTASSFASWPLY